MGLRAVIFICKNQALGEGAITAYFCGRIEAGIVRVVLEFTSSRSCDW
jgi:hypothetical protein